MEQEILGRYPDLSILSSHPTEIGEGFMTCYGSTSEIWHVDLLDFDAFAKEKRVSWWGIASNYKHPGGFLVVLTGSLGLTGSELLDAMTRRTPRAAEGDGKADNNIEQLILEAFEPFRVKMKTPFICLESEGYVIVTTRFEGCIPGADLVQKLKLKLPRCILLCEPDLGFCIYVTVGGNGTKEPNPSVKEALASAKQANLSPGESNASTKNDSAKVGNPEVQVNRVKSQKKNELLKACVLCLVGGAFTLLV